MICPQTDDLSDFGKVGGNVEQHIERRMERNRAAYCSIRSPIKTNINRCESQPVAVDFQVSVDVTQQSFFRFEDQVAGVDRGCFCVKQQQWLAEVDDLRLHRKRGLAKMDLQIFRYHTRFGESDATIDTA